MALTCPGLPVSETTETSKGERDQSMPGNVSKSGAAVRWGAQGKVCMVKAVLPESQFPVAKGLAVANAADTLCHARQIVPASALCHQSAWDDHHRWVKETNGTPKHAATSHRGGHATAGSPAAGSFEDLCGDGGRHSTQMPDVMAGETAAARRMIMRIRPGDRTESASDRGRTMSLITAFAVCVEEILRRRGSADAGRYHPEKELNHCRLCRGRVSA